MKTPSYRVVVALCFSAAVLLAAGPPLRSVAGQEPATRPGHRPTYLVPIGSPVLNGRVFLICESRPDDKKLYPWAGVLLTECILSGLPAADTSWRGNRVRLPDEFVLGDAVVPPVVGLRAKNPDGKEVVTLGLYAKSLDLFLPIAGAQLTVEGAAKTDLVFLTPSEFGALKAFPTIFCPPDQFERVRSLLKEHGTDDTPVFFLLAPKIRIEAGPRLVPL